MMLVQDQTEIFGTIAAPTGAPTDLGGFIGGAIRIFLIIAAIALLIYMLWGAFDWITSGGEKEKISKAQSKLTNAIIGMFIVVVALAVFQVIGGNILNIIEITPEGWKFNLPKIGP